MNNRKDISQARPSLRQVSPLTFWIALGFSILNIGVAISLFRQPNYGGLVIESGWFSTTFWAWVFVFMAVGVLISFAINSWSMTRKFLMLGLITKSFFAYALINLGFRKGFDTAFGVTLLWVFLSWVQFWTVVYFLPPVNRGEQLGE